MSEWNDFDLLLETVRNSFQALFKQHHETFYYCTLILSDGATPFISAFSEETLKEAVKNNPDDSADDLKWSYADSPYCGYGFEEYFQELDNVFSKRMNAISSDEEYNKEIEHWLFLMEKVMKTLDKEKLFGEGKERRRMILNAEIMPPDETNAERASRLNAKRTYQKWYKENFEDENIVPDDFIERLSKMSRGEIVLSLRDMTTAEVEATIKYLEKLNQEHPL
ncbi:MAG: DUF4303 domain-containing protein [Oscillospiraceae bacterium]|nr:DUF4303 domain-containing protein [Oscillospiraceae bacterium]